MQRGDPNTPLTWPSNPKEPPMGEQRSVRPWHVNVALAAFIVTLIVGALSVGQSISGIESAINRNCRTLNTIQSDVRFIIVQHVEEYTPKRPNERRRLGSNQADQFRQIFNSAGQERC